MGGVSVRSAFESINSHLKRMGYEVIENEKFGYIRIILTTESKYHMHLTVHYEDLIKPDIIAVIVAHFNETIKTSF